MSNVIPLYLVKRQKTAYPHVWADRLFIRESDANKWGQDNSLDYTLEMIPFDLGDDTYTASLLKMAND